MSEHDEQVAVVQWFGYQYQKYADLLFSIPNGTHLAGDARVRAIKVRKLKEEGLVPGVPDLFLAVPKGGYSGLFIEMKDEGKTRSSNSKDQLKMQSKLSGQGYKTEWCAGSGKAIEVIKWYMALP